MGDDFFNEDLPSRAEPPQPKPVKRSGEPPGPRPLMLDGVYEHFRTGERYEVLYSAQHSETREHLVVYRNIKNPMKVWARPREMFLGKIEHECQTVKRFRLVEFQHVVPESWFSRTWQRLKKLVGLD